MLKTNTRLSGCFTAGLAGLLLMLNAAALAGSLDAPAAPTAAGSAMYTLQDLCNRLNTGAAGTLRTGPFAEPSVGPAATMCTLNEIMAAMPTVDANGAGVADVLAGKTFWGLLAGGGWGLKTGGMSNVGAQNIMPSTTVQTISAGYHSGAGQVAGDNALTAANIKTGITIFNVLGTYTGTAPTGTALAGDVLTGKTFSNSSGTGITGTMSNNGAFSLTCGATDQPVTVGYYSGGTLTGDADLQSTNIKKDTVIFGATGTYESPPCTCSGTLNGTRWCDNLNGTVTDLLGSTVNGKLQGRCLVWLKDASWGGAKAWRVNVVDHHDDAHTRAGLLSASATDKPADLADGSVVGDWRLPTLTELKVLTAGTGAVSSANMRAFTGVQSYAYWSSATIATYPSAAWSVYLSDGSVDAGDKAGTLFVWPVRGGL